jgi:serine protease Do
LPDNDRVRRGYWLIHCLVFMAVLSARPVLAADFPDFTTVVSKVSAVVVNISAVQSAVPLAGDVASDNPGGKIDGSYPDWHRHYFESPSPDRNMLGSGGDSNIATAVSLGSGFIISSDGEILTNYHVVAHAQGIRVKLDDRRVLPARILGVDPQSDLALLKIHADRLTAASINTRPVRVGQWVLAIGSPFGFDHSVTAGIISAEGRSINGEQYVPYIQTDVPINPGNSGGPLFNLQGQVVGINAEIYSDSGGYQGVSFAIPMNLAMQVVRQLRERGHVIRGWLGVSIGNVDTDLARTLHLSRPEGALVRTVMPASPAARAGIKAGDVILSYDGMPVVSSESLPPLVGGTVVGHEVPVTVLHDGYTDMLNVRVDELPASAAAATVDREAVPDMGIDVLGLVTRALAPGERKQIGVRHGGVLVERVGRGAAQSAGVRPGDVALMMDGTSITGPSQFRRLEKQLPDRPVPLLVRRSGENLFLALQVGGA